MLLTAVVLPFLGVAVCHTFSRPQPHAPISLQDREFLRSLPSPPPGYTYPAGFRVFYMNQAKHIVHGNRPSGSYIKVVGSPRSSKAAVDRFADQTYRMLKSAPPAIFNKLASNGAGVGVFSHAEKLTIFPEYASMKDTPECFNDCKGPCAHTCTSDGRKWESLAGIGGIVALVSEANIMCYQDDPYGHRNNIAVHEFAHTIDVYGFDDNMKQIKENAFRHSWTYKVWRLDAYGMSNSLEYFAEATASFFVVNFQPSPGGMNECHGPGRYCRTEPEVWNHLFKKDLNLYSFLVHVYTNNRGYSSPSGLTVCPSHTPNSIG
ncbi:uncharacterized protein LOC143296889 [Babylonia areolata]|uniref:uncharacterized protein LOC143296889 n=1 Tax=Babylonia areolata TaxID=304850 RepID=UPI003FD264D8